MMNSFNETQMSVDNIKILTVRYFVVVVPIFIYLRFTWSKEHLDTQLVMYPGRKTYHGSVNVYNTQSLTKEKYMTKKVHVLLHQPKEPENTITCQTKSTISLSTPLSLYRDSLIE